MDEITAEEFERIASEIRMKDSPVGFDALKTHVMILHKLGAIESRLERLEQLSDENVSS